MAEDPRLRLVFQEAQRSINEQQAVVDELRARTGTVLSAASISTGFLGAVALGREHPNSWAIVLAIGAFAVMALIALLILYPWAWWHFRFPVYALLTEYVEREDSLDINGMLRDLSIHLEANHASNARRVDWLQRGLSLTIGLLGVQIVAWLLSFV